MSEGYLHKCWNDFREVSEQKYGTPFDLAAIEHSVKYLRRRTPLMPEDLRYFRDPKHWWFQKYWVFPPGEHLDTALAGVTFDFWNLPRNEAAVIAKLLEVFKSIGLVSIILRFIKPEAYGIISSPVERVLDVCRGSNAIETYQNYLGNLRAVRKHYDFPRTADADMALWVLHERCFGTLQHPNIVKEYNRDPFMLRLRAKNLVAPLAALSHPRLAEALVAIKADLAALIACYQLEILIRQAGDRAGVGTLGSGRDLDEVINQMPNYGSVDALRKAKWRRLKSIRNDLFHKGRLPSQRQTRDLIEEVVRLEQELAQPNSGGGESSPGY